MTSINVLRFDKYSGICIGDESISSVADMRVNAGQKVRPFVPAPIVEQYGTVAVLGTTGSCSMGDNIQDRLEDYLREKFQEEIEKHGKKPEEFMTVEEIARACYDVVVQIKHKRIDEKIRGTYNFGVGEFIEGKYSQKGKEFKINDKDSIREVLDLMVWRHNMDDVNYIFMNAGLLAGYDDRLGFQIYHFDLRDGIWHRVQNCYMAEGSGRHSVDPAIYRYAEKWLSEERRGNLDPVEGSIAMLHGINTAADHEIGVGGYYNIILIDGRQKDYKKRLREINDDRSLLANHIVRGLDNNFLSYKEACSMIKETLFDEVPFEEVYDKLWKTVKEPEVFSKILRGYKLISRRMF